MSLFRRLPTLLVTLSLLLGAVVPAGGVAVLCFGEDHIAVEAMQEEHCGDGHGEAGSSLANADPDCNDLTPSAVPLDRAGDGASVPSLLPLASAWIPMNLGVDAPAGVAWAPLAPRPPPHLVSIDTLVLRL